MFLRFPIQRPNNESHCKPHIFHEKCNMFNTFQWFSHEKTRHSSARSASDDASAGSHAPSHAAAFGVVPDSDGAQRAQRCQRRVGGAWSIGGGRLLMSVMWVYPLVKIQKTMENHIF